MRLSNLSLLIRKTDQTEPIVQQFPVLKGLIFIITLCISLHLNTAYSIDNSGLSLKRRIIRLAPHGSVLLSDENGKPLLTHGAEQILIPASIIKIYTALVAYDILSPDYHFKTEFFTDIQNNLAIKGWGDPFLISEEINLITDQLKLCLASPVKQLYLDHSAFSNNLQIDGISHSLNPYDALNGALAVNFNTIFIKKDPSGTLYSAEAVTPLTPLAIKKSIFLKPGGEERINLADNKAESLQYAGELFSALLKNANITVNKQKIGYVKIDHSWQLKLRHYNQRNLNSMIKALFKYSNNYIANQLLLVIGAEKKGYPATLEKSRAVFKAYLNRHFPQASPSIIIDEASGISRNNKISGAMMINILSRFKKYSDLLNLKNHVLVKSGTLTGVYNYAGYFITQKGLRPFVIMTNQKKNNRNRILKLLHQYSITKISPS